MAQFRFRLQQVLKYRAQLEEQAKMAFAQEQLQYQAQAQRVTVLRKTLAEHEPKLYQTNNQAEIWLLRNFIQGLSADIARAESALLEQAQRLNKARQHLVKRSQERQLIDKLKENQAKRHAQEELFKERQQFDETATIRHKPQAV